MRIADGLFAALMFVASACLADQEFETRDLLQFDHSVLNDSVFQVRLQQRLLAAAQKHISDGDYAAAFDVLHKLLQQPYDSSYLVSGDDRVHGTRSVALRSLSKLPSSVRRDWSQFCQGPGTKALNNALRSRSRVALARVAAEFPYSSVAADALITETILALNTGQVVSAQLTLKQLQEIFPVGLLTRTQTTAVRRLNTAVDHYDAFHDAHRTLAAPVRHRSLHPEPDWSWMDNAWRHPQGPDALPVQGLGSQFEQSAGWQHPILRGDVIITRTPAGIASLDRLSGSQRWFLPFRSVVLNRGADGTEVDTIFEITQDLRSRLEISGDVIFFVDGQRAVARQPFQGIQSPLVLQQGATHLVAVRLGQSPVVLWQAGGEPIPQLAAGGQSLSKTEMFKYAFEMSVDSGSSTKTLNSAVATTTSDDRLTGHLFLSAPRVFADRLYVTTRHDGMTWLNCLSIAHGILHWQQPLTWQKTDSEDIQHNSAIVGGIAGDRVVCLFSNGLIAGCNSIDGRIEWVQSVLYHDESVGETGDFWMATQADSRFVPQAGAGSEFGSLWMLLSPAEVLCSRRGSPGISCLDIATGDIRWSVSRSVLGGTTAHQQDLTCVGLTDSQLIMMGYSHCRAINVADGSQTWVRPLGNHNGRVCCDHRTVYVALNSGRLLTLDGHNGSVVHSQRLNLSKDGPGLVSDQTGIVEASAWNIRSWKWREGSLRLKRLTVEDALDALVMHRLHHLTGPAIHSVAACIAAATNSTLSASQQLKFSLVTPDSPGHHAILEEQLLKKPDQFIQLLPGWKLPLSTAIHTLGLSSLVGFSHSNPDDSVLFPERLGSLDSQLAAATKLLSDNRRSQAEVMLLNMDVTSRTDLASQRDQLLHTARSSVLAPGILMTDRTEHGRAEFQVTPNSTDGFRFSDIAANYQRFRLRTPAAVVPSWSQSLFITDTGASPHVGLIDPGRGIENAWTSRSSVRFPNNVSDQQDWNSPGLTAVLRKRCIGVISVLSNSPLTPLWLRSIDNEAAGQVIAMSSRQLIVSSNAGVQSLHPLTGSLLWSHNWKESRAFQHLEGQFFKVYCSDSHIILLSSLGTGYVVLRTIDGAIVREDSRRSGKLSRVIDEYLLTKTTQDQLETTHLVSGKPVPVDLSGHAVVDFNSASQIGRAKAMVITAAPELIILDLPSGLMETRIPIPNGLNDTAESLLTPRLLRRAGLIYVALSVRNWQSPYVPELIFGEAVTGKGVLICIDSETGEELWQQQRNSVVIPLVFGDPCPFLVLWSTKYASGRRHLGFRGGRQKTLPEITVLDAFTGTLVATTKHRLAARPLQVIHDARQRELRITTSHSTIRMDYAK